MTKIADCDSYVTSITTPQLIKSTKLLGGSPIMNGIRPEMYTGGYCVVFPYIVSNKKYAVRCWHAHLENAQERTRIIADYLSTVKLPYFVAFEYEENGIATAQGVMPIVTMDWVDALSFKEYIKRNLNNPSRINKIASDFLIMVKELHDNKISHGDLQQGNIMVTDDGRIVLVDYDSMYVPELSDSPCEIPGTLGYQHPLRFKTKLKTSPRADYFSELIIYLSLKAIALDSSLWSDLNIEDTDTLLFTKEDLESLGNSAIFKRLSSYQSTDIDSLLYKLVEYLKSSDIDGFEPLEKIAPEALAMVDLEELSNKWRNNGYKSAPIPPIDTKMVVDDLKTQWNKSTSTTGSDTVDEIRKLWN